MVHLVEPANYFTELAVFCSHSIQNEFCFSSCFRPSSRTFASYRTSVSKKDCQRRRSFWRSPSKRWKLLYSEVVRQYFPMRTSSYSSEAVIRRCNRSTMSRGTIIWAGQSYIERLCRIYLTNLSKNCHERIECYRLFDRKKILFFLFSSRLVSSQFHRSHKVNDPLFHAHCWLFRPLLITTASMSSSAWVVLARYLFIIHTHDIFHDFLQSFVHLIDTQMNIMYSFKVKVIYG